MIHFIMIGIMDTILIIMGGIDRTIIIGIIHTIITVGIITIQGTITTVITIIINHVENTMRPEVHWVLPVITIHHIKEQVKTVT
jgi:hypothetical protein